MDVVDLSCMLWTSYGCIILYKMACTDDMDDALLACSSVYVASAAVIMYLYASQKSRLKKRKHRVWISKYLCIQPQYGAYKSLMRDLLELDTTKFRNYIRMDPDIFEQL